MLLRKQSRRPVNLRRRMQIRMAFVALAGIVAVGTLGYMIVEEMSALEALFLTMAILTTIGLAAQESMADLTAPGMVFTIVLAVVGLGTVTYAVSFLIREIIAGELNALVGKRVMQRQISGLSNHFIVCGFGRFGRIIAEELRDSKASLVVIEPGEARFRELAEEGFVGIQGDALDDEILDQAQISSARCLISTIDSDASNVFLILSAREKNPQIHVVVRGEVGSAIDKLKRVGANAVISPITLGAEMIAQAALRPHVVEFFSVTTSARHEGYQIEEILVREGSAMADKSLREQAVARDHGVMIIGIRRQGERDTVFNPPADAVIHVGDILIALGESENVERFAVNARK